MIASLGMYDLPAVQPSNDRFWTAIRAHLGFGPTALERGRDLWEVWRDPDLLLAQTCGMPFRTKLYDQVRLIGTPDYGLPGCPPGYYNSVIIARADGDGARLADFAGKRFAHNEALSQSGWAAPMTHAQGTRFAQIVQTHSHAGSAQAVSEGRADVAAIDALTWALLCEHAPLTQTLRVVERTAPTPGLPYITAKHRDPAPLFEAIQTAIEDLSDADRAALHLRGLIYITPASYSAVPTPVPPPAT